MILEKCAQLTHFSRFFKGTFSRESPVKPDVSDRFQLEKILKMIKNVCLSVSYCNRPLLICLGSSLSLNDGLFLTWLAEHVLFASVYTIIVDCERVII